MKPEHFSAFKAYDIRATSPEVIDAAFSSNLGAAILSSMKPKKVLVGHDMRLTSHELEAALVNSLVQGGADVTKIGMCSTSMFYVLVGMANKAFDLGVMITASHNPGIYNGFKIVHGDCMPVGLGSGLEAIRDAMTESPFTESPLDKGGSKGGFVTEDPTALDRYIDFVIRKADLPADMPDIKVSIDAGNGMAGFVLPKLLEKCPWIKAEQLYFEPDGNFPNHEANPLKAETLSALKLSVKKSGSALGVAFDGDADRVGFIDENGEQIAGDLLTALFSKIELAKKPGGRVLFDVRSSWAVPETITQAGGIPQMYKVGHAYIKNEMRKTGAMFAGEVSMHYYFSELWDVECTDYAMLLLLKELALSKSKLSDLWKPLKKYVSLDEMNYKVKDTNIVLKHVEQYYSSKASKVINIDGIRCEFGDPATDPYAWWFNLRASNTEPLVRLNMEAQSKEELMHHLEELNALIEQNEAV